MLTLSLTEFNNKIWAGYIQQLFEVSEKEVIGDGLSQTRIRTAIELAVFPLSPQNLLVPTQSHQSGRSQQIINRDRRELPQPGSVALQLAPYLMVKD